MPVRREQKKAARKLPLRKHILLKNIDEHDDEHDDDDDDKHDDEHDDEHDDDEHDDEHNGHRNFQGGGFEAVVSPGNRFPSVDSHQ